VKGTKKREAATIDVNLEKFFAVVDGFPLSRE